jgi:ribosomal protein S18 acetylase RimI-like enzyme
MAAWENDVPGQSMIRPAEISDRAAIAAIILPAIRAGETYALPRDWSEDEAVDCWFAPGHHVFVNEVEGEVLGTYYLQANQKGGGAHIANCGYATHANAQGKGLARAMCEHSLEIAKAMGFRAMQFNLVISTNTRAVALWQSCGFEIMARLPGVFDHPSEGYVDAFVMFRGL